MISLIIPTYKERENIKPLLVALSNLKLKDFEVIIVDDQSPDGTANEAEQVAKQLSLPIKVVRRNGPKDLSLSVLCGFKEASGDVVGVMDADLSHPPEIIPKILDELENADLVVASRKASGSEIKNWPFKRKINAWVARFLAQTLTRRVSDPMSGFFFFKRNVIEGIELKPLGYKILLEILVRGNYRVVKEVSFVFKDRQSGESKLNLKIIFKFLFHVLKLHLWKIRR